MRSRRGRDAPEAVGRRRRDAAPEQLEQFARDRVRREAKADGVLPTGDEVFRLLRALEHQRQRAGPELRGQVARRGRSVAGPRKCLVRESEVNDDWVVGWAALD